jgi:iron complex outermembrane recepter protein
MSLLICFLASLHAATPNAPSAETSVPELDEIVVRARRKDIQEPEQTLPISVDVLTESQLRARGLQRASELNALGSSLGYRAIFGASAPQFFIRGIGSNDINPSGNPAVSVYLGDVLLASPIGQNMALFDLSAVEVAKGPQGTLFGRNATAGSIRLIPNSPEAGTSARLGITLGRFHQRDVDAMANIGNEDVAFRVAGFVQDADGYIANSAQNTRESDTEALGARLSSDVRLSEEWRAQISLDSAKNRAGMRAHRGIGLLPGGRNVLGFVYPADPYRQGYDRQDREHVDNTGASLRLVREGPVQLEWISSVRDAKRSVRDDADASPVDLIGLNFDNDSEQRTHELRVHSDTAPIAWQAGLFYLNDTLQTTNRFDVLGVARAAGAPFNPQFGPFVLQQDYTQSVQSIAAYAEAEVPLSEQSDLTLGFRQTREKVDFKTRTVFAETQQIPLGSPRTGDVRDSGSSWRIALAHRFSDMLSTYASVNRGFKSSGFNGGALFPNDDIGPLAPEFLTAYELGATWQSSVRTQWRASMFHYDYQDLQVFTLVAAQPTFQSKESTDATVDGVELRVRSQITSNLGLQADITLLDARYRRFIDANNRDLTGNRLTAAPKSAAYVGMDWQVADAGNWRLLLRADANFRSRIYFDGSERVLLSAPSRTLLGMGVALENATTRIALDAHNVLNKVDLVDALDFSQYGFVQQTFGPPARWSLSLTRRFD